MVYQHFTLVPAMTVAENLVLARDDVPAVVDWAKEKKELEAFLARMPFKVPLDARVSDISAGERQKCEILKQLYLKRRFLILDEPTSVLTPGEADEVLGMLRGMVVGGELTILMITHKFREVMAFADEVTILRRGKLAGRGKVAELTPDGMARMMIGAEELTIQPPRVGEVGAARLELDRTQRARRCRRGRGARRFARRPRRRDRRHRRRLRQRPAPAGRGAGRPARGRERRNPRRRRCLSRHAARRCAGTRCRCCRKSR